LLTSWVVAVVRGDSNIKGTVTFEQESENSLTTVSWDITGHDANAKRGMHIHTFGDNTNGCTSAGPHCESFTITTSEGHISVRVNC
jgi:Cu-Zn family superoxide dismutase